MIKILTSVTLFFGILLSTIIGHALISYITSHLMILWVSCGVFILVELFLWLKTLKSNFDEYVFGGGLENEFKSNKQKLHSIMENKVKEKAEELVRKYWIEINEIAEDSISHRQAKHCAITCVDEILKTTFSRFWEEVKEYLINMK